MTVLNHQGEVIEVDAAESFLSLEAFGAESGSHVYIEAGEDIETLADHLASIEIVALNFPAFTDGRAYSSASILRRTYGYAGQIRAVGDVRVDQLEQMVRCGFDAFDLADGQDVMLAAEKLAGFTYSYQSTIDRDPVFRVRG